jgi:uncharacterized protein YqeY
MLHEKIESDLKSALKSGEKEKAGVLRLLISAVKNFQIEKKLQDKDYISDDDVVSVFKRQAKQRKDSIEQYEKGGRVELAEKEKKELEIIEGYLPAQMDEAKIREIVKAKISELGITGKFGFGKLMGAVMKETAGQADGAAVKKAVEEELG